MSTPPWSVTYHDGSANAYRINGDRDGARFEYVPVTPERSSSGLYSGGAPRAGRLDTDATESLWQRLRAFEADASCHAEHRAKGTGAFALQDSSGERAFLVTPGPALRAFDAFVAGLR